MISNSHSRPIMNLAYLRSIPLPWDYKRYFISKYSKMVQHNGAEFAADAFTSLFEFVEFYLSKPIKDRQQLKSEYTKRVQGIRYGNRILQTLRLAMSNPSEVLNLLKISSAAGATVPMDEALEQYLNELDGIKAHTDVPKFLKRFLGEVKHVNRAFGDEKRMKRIYRTQRANHVGLAYHRPYDIWYEYWQETLPMYKPFSQREVLDAATRRPFAVVPEKYHDYDPTSRTSKLYDKETIDLIAGENGVMEGVDPWLLAVTAGGAMNAQATLAMSGEAMKVSVAHVGKIDLVKKKGTNTYRPVANTSKYLQFGTFPIYRLLTKRTEPRGDYDYLHGRRYIDKTIWQYDASFNQDRFNSWISNRVSNPNLYIASVDLHHATDYLPFAWGTYIVDTLLGCGDYTVEDVRNSFDVRSGNQHKPTPWETVVWSWLLFKQVAHAPYTTDNPLRDARWKNGQPLGALPSFRLLAWTHNVLLESLAWSMGYSHHPYRILGDDLVVSNKKLRNAYVRCMKSNGVKLSLQKSYSGRLVEFAGKRFVANQPPFHTPDQPPYVNINSIFDWARVTHIPLRFRNLPISVKEWIRRFYARIRATDVSLENIKSLSLEEYNLWEKNRQPDRLFDFTSIMASMNPTYLQGVPKQVAHDYLSKLWPDELERALNARNRGHKESGLTIIMSHPIYAQPPRLIDKDGYFMRYTPTHIQPWFARKVRPVSTRQRLRLTYDAVWREFVAEPALLHAVFGSHGGTDE